MAEVQDLEVSSEIGEIEAVENKAAEVESKQEPEAPIAEELEPRYRGKTPAEIAKMHQEAEKLIARQATEVGEVRKLADELIKSQLFHKPEAEKPKEVDFFENPQEAIRQAVETNPRVLAAEQLVEQIRRVQAQQALVQKHPDFGNVVSDPEFVDWVKSSRFRIDLFQQAHAYNVDAADELFSTYKALKAVKQAPVTVDTKARDQSLKAAAVDTGGSGETSKKVYRRADLLNLRLRDPARYDAMQGEIDAAYREGRVR